MMTITIDELNTITLDNSNSLSFSAFCRRLGNDCNLSDDDKFKLFALTKLIEDGVLDRYAESIYSSIKGLPSASKRNISFYPLMQNDSVTIKGNQESTYRHRTPLTQFSKHTAYVLSSVIKNGAQDSEIIKSELSRLENTWAEAAKIAEIFLNVYLIPKKGLPFLVKMT